MNNRILILYLHPDAFDPDYDEGFSEGKIRVICNQSERLIYENEYYEYYIFRFEYQKNNFVFVLTKENDPDSCERGVPWSELKEILERYIHGKYVISIFIQHKGHKEGLKLEELESELHDYKELGLSTGSFYSKIKVLIEKFGEKDFESCQKIMDDFFVKNKELSSIEFRKIPPRITQKAQENVIRKSKDKKNGISEIIESDELNDILKELKYCKHELTLVMSPAKRYLIKHLNSGKCFLLIKQKEKKENTEALKKIVVNFKGKRLYMVIHGISADIDFDAVKQSVKNFPGINLNYCDYSRSGYPHIKIPYNKIINGIEVSENYEKLKKAIKQSYQVDQMVKAINIAIYLFYPLSIDLRGLEDVTDEMKKEYFNDILISIKNRYEDHLTYFRQKLVNLRYFVSGTIEESTIDVLDPNIEIFKDSNLKSLPANNINKQKAEELSGSSDEKSPIIGFMRLLDEALEKVKKEEKIEIIRKAINFFKEQNWKILDHEINNYHDWFSLLVYALNNIKKEIINGKH